MSTVVFEDESWENFVPMSLTRHVSQQLIGTATILDYLSKRFGEGISLAGRALVADVASEETGLEFNGALEKDILLINGRMNPFADHPRSVTKKSSFVLTDKSGDVAMAALPRARFEGAASADGTISQKKLTSLCKGLEPLQSQDELLFRYPWEIMGANDRFIARGAGPLEDAKRQAGAKGGGRICVSPDAEVEEFVSFDARGGPIIVEGRARIESFSRISGPCFIGSESVVHSALVRGGTTIGKNCRIGGEVDQSIVYPFTNKAHLGFLGHSTVGSWVNLGAGSVTSDLKNTYGTIKVPRVGARVDTGMVKVGAMVGDMAKVSSCSMVHCGKSLGVASHSSGLVDRDVPDFTHFEGGDADAAFILRLDSAIKTQTSMMLRRGVVMTEARRKLMERLHDRAQAGRASRS